MIGRSPAPEVWATALELLNEAERVPAAAIPRMATHAAYYAVFHAARAVLIQLEGLNAPTKHRGLEAGPAQHLAWVVDLVDSRLDALRLRIPGLKADLSLLVHQADFETSDLPAQLLERAVRIGDLEVEVPDENLDVVLTSTNWRDVATAKRPHRHPGGTPG